MCLILNENDKGMLYSTDRQRSQINKLLIRKMILFEEYSPQIVDHQSQLVQFLAKIMFMILILPSTT